MFILLQLEGNSTADLLLKKKVQMSMQNLLIFLPLWIVLFKRNVFDSFAKWCILIHKDPRRNNEFKSSLEKQRNGCFQTYCTISTLNKTSLFLLSKNFLDLLYQCISKIFCNNYKWESMSPSLIVRKPNLDLASLNLKSAISHFSVWVL